MKMMEQYLGPVDVFRTPRIHGDYQSERMWSRSLRASWLRSYRRMYKSWVVRHGTGWRWTPRVISGHRGWVLYLVEDNDASPV